MGDDSRGQSLEQPSVDLTEAPFSASVYALDVRTGEPILAVDPAIPLLPASNAKLVTAARGFAELGPDYRFETTVHAVGEVRNGHLLGDLVITGYGSPDLSQADLMELATAVAKTDIDTVAGELVIDATAFDTQSLGPGWTWDDGQFAYGAKSTPLAVERNTVDITVAHRNGSINVDVSPTSEIVRFDVDVETGPECALEVYKQRASEVIRVEGEIAPGESVVKASPVDDPLMHAGSLCKQALEAAGVTIDGWVRVENTPVETGGEPCAIVESAPLETLIAEMLTVSDNFVAEQIARTIAYERDGVGSWRGWHAHASAFLDDRGADAARLRDGSGVSRYNLLSAETIVSVLEWALDQPWGEQFRQALPRTGHDGTVANRLEAVPVPARAKTGTLTGARALSGVLEEPAGTPAVIFSCLFSNLTGEHEEVATDRIDDVVETIATRAGLA